MTARRRFRHRARGPKRSERNVVIGNDAASLWHQLHAAKDDLGRSFLCQFFFRRVALANRGPGRNMPLISRSKTKGIAA